MIVVIRKNWNAQHLAAMDPVTLLAIIHRIEVYRVAHVQINQKLNQEVDRIPNRWGKFPI